MADSVPLVLAWRGGLLEGAHHGRAVILDPAGRVERCWGDPDAVVLPRSALKPAQAAGILRAGAELDGELLALAASSHSGEPWQVRLVRHVLAGAGRSPAELRCPPEQPYDPAERDARVAAGLGPTRLTMTCSGKHAAMLAACTRRGWPTESYLDPDHPLQALLRAEVERLSGEEVAGIGVDGCGAPLFALSLTGLARAVAACVTAAPGSAPRRVADAMRAHPTVVGGHRRDVSGLMRALPGALVKDGAEGVGVAVLPDGRAAAVKIDDGADRARQVALVALLRRLGADPAAVAPWASQPVHGGGVPVGALRPSPALGDEDHAC